MKIKYLLVIVILFNLFIACNKDVKNNVNQITIGWIGVLTGEAAPYGIAVKNGTDLAVEEINNAGGIKNKKIKIIYEDDKADPKTGINAMNRLISLYKPPVIIQAAASSVMLSNIPIAEKNHVVYISPSCSNDKIKDGGDYIFRIWPSDSYQGTFIARHIFNKMGISKAAVININNDFGVGLKTAFIDEYNLLGGEIVTEQSFLPESVDMRSQLQKIKNTGAKIIFIPSHVKETIRALKQAKELGLDIPFFADAAAFSEKLINDASGTSENLYIANLDWDINSTNPLIQKFVKNYQKKFNQEPDIYAAAGYDLIYVLKKAMINAKELNSDDIKNSLYHIKDFSGVTGIITFNKLGEVEKEYSVYKIVDKKFIKSEN